MEAPGTNIRSGQRLAVVVGAGGMAMAAARRLGNTYRLFVVDRDGDHLGRQLAALRAEGHDAAGMPCDVTEADDVRACADAVAGIGPVHALAHVVGLSPSMGDAEAILRVNLRGPALVAEAFLPLVASGGAGLFVSSVSGHLGPLLGEVGPEILEILDEPLAYDLVERVFARTGPMAPPTAYQYTKTALIRMVRRQAAAWGARGARIVSLSPGMIGTPMGAQEYANPNKMALFQRTPLGREGTMVEIADAFEFLLSDRASFISGTDLLVDGGLAAAVSADAAG
ncbi:SDR family oxidoreductase [Amycolatopsis sp. GM8]|uniref:SDR family oxidoreductase n=1 Tax=Amycolatopsis sp. GM8 TaxID=2896530 RepID=UPI001F409888|nr:SDR family oxidoreductase [Amycolatopsis sp. GM8]